MDALTALWFTSLVGAVGFTATGYFLAKSRVTEPASAPERASTPAPALAPAPAPAPAPALAPAPAPAPAPDTSDLERQLDAIRIELRAEVVARNKVETQARELATRLSAMSEQAAGLRARASVEMNAVRGRDSAQKRSSIIPSAASDAARSRLSMRAPGLFAEIDELKAEIARLAAENTSLRAASLGTSAPPPRPPGGRTDGIVPEVLKLTIDRIMRLPHVRAAAIAEGSGLVVAGSGELADALAAFGAYIRDAAARSVRLLPLRAADEVTVRDRQGLVFSARAVGPAESGLSLVMLASGDVSAREIRDIVSQTPGLDAGAGTAR